jgi:hypothetical protein
LALGCATGYQSSDTSLSGGFSEIRLAPDEWRVLVEGNGFTTRGEAEQILMRRSAELTLEQGKRYFSLTGHDAWLNARYTKNGSRRTSPASEAIVTALADGNGRAFDAVKVIEETNEAAEGKLSEAARATLQRLTKAES